MPIIKHKDKRTGTTYVYESKSYWDKEKKQPRSKRTLIGKINEETGEIVPTDGRGKKRTTIKKPVSDVTALCAEKKQQLKEKDLLISQLMNENKKLKKELAAVLSEIRGILGKYDERR
jgi:hypothetical protein